MPQILPAPYWANLFLKREKSSSIIARFEWLPFEPSWLQGGSFNIIWIWRKALLHLVNIKQTRVEQKILQSVSCRGKLRGEKKKKKTRRKCFCVCMLFMWVCVCRWGVVCVFGGGWGALITHVRCSSLRVWGRIVFLGNLLHVHGLPAWVL